MRHDFDSKTEIPIFAGYLQIGHDRQSCEYSHNFLYKPSSCTRLPCVSRHSPTSSTVPLHIEYPTICGTVRCVQSVHHAYLAR